MKKWVKFFSCYLQAVVLRQWGRYSRVCSVSFSRIAGKSTNWNWQEKLVQMKISLSYKIQYIKEVMGNLFLLVGVSLLLWALVLFACASCSAPSSHKQSFSRLPMQVEREEQSGFSDSSLTHQRKSQSISLVDTLPIWGKQHSVGFSDFILDQAQGDD